MIKQWMLAVALCAAVVAPAQARPVCWPTSPVVSASNRYLSSSQLWQWWQANGVPNGVINPHYYVALHASDQYCKANIAPSAWSVMTGPQALVGTTNGTIAGGVYFSCMKCYENPGDEEMQP